MITKWKWLNLVPVPICRPHTRRHAEHVLPRGIATKALQERGICHFTTFAVYVDDDYVNAFGPAALDCVREYGQLLRS